MKPNRLILKLVIVAVASTVAGCAGSRGVRTTPFIVSRVGGFPESARGTNSFALVDSVTSVSHSKLRFDAIGQVPRQHLRHVRRHSGRARLRISPSLMPPSKSRP